MAARGRLVEGWRSGAGRRLGQAEVDRRGRGLARLGLEEIALQEAEHPGEDIARERLDPVVVLEDRRVVVLAAERDLVLGRGQLLLERQDVLVRLEVRVVLDNGEQGSQGRG